MNKLYNVLLVDDDYTSNYLHTMLLEESGRVKNAYIYTQPEKVIQSLRDACLGNPDPCWDDFPDLILLDLKMPNMNGFEFMEAFRQLPGIEGRSTKVYLVTTSSHPRDMDLAKKYRLSGYINKPVTKETIDAILGETQLASTAY